MTELTYGRDFPEMDLPILAWGSDYKTALKERGCVLIQVDHLSSDEYMALASELGTPLRESSAVDATYVDHGVILNILTQLEEGITVSNEPFSIHALRMHIERAYSPQESQPNYLAFYCVEAPERENGGQTLLLSMEDFKRNFNSEELDLLRRLYPKIRNGELTSPNPIYAHDERRDLSYFSYRDLGVYGVDWEFVEKAASEEVLVRLAEKISAHLYSPNTMHALSWKPGYLYIFDNKKYFHGRTEQQKRSRRHLQRIRMI